MRRDLSPEEIDWHKVALVGAAAFFILVLAVVVGSSIASSMAAQAAADRAAREALNATPVPTPTPIIQVVYVNVTPVQVTPVPTFNPYAQGGRELGQQFTWHRDNVSGLKDMDINVTVWGYKMLPYYRYWYDGTGGYRYQQPDAGKKYLFVYVAIWVPGDVSTNDARLWLPAADQYYVQCRDKVLPLDPTYMDYGPYALEISEMQFTQDYSNSSIIGYYGKHLSLDRNGKVFLESDAVVHLGESNTISGFIIYQVPADAEPKDIAVLGSFASFGSAYWRLS